MILAIAIVLIVLLVLGLTVLGASVRVLREYERGVVFRLGRVMDIRGPGLILLMPTIDRMVRVSLRTITLTVPPQEIITRDNIPVRVTAVAYYRVVDPNKAINQVENFHNATLQIAQTTLRSVLGGVDLDHLLGEREILNESLQRVIDAQTEPWGIKVTTVEIKDVEIPERMQHAIARQAEAERERRAKIINAEGEAQAATRLADAADIIGRNPTTLQLRYLQTLREIGATQNTTVVFPMPIDLIKPVLDAVQSAGASSASPAPQAAPENGALEPGESRALGAGTPTPSAPPASALRRALRHGGRSSRRALPHPRRGRAVETIVSVRRELQRQRGRHLLGVGELERERQALDLVLLDLRLEALALADERTAERDRRAGGRLLERDHELAVLDHGRLDLGTRDPEPLDQRRGRAVLLPWPVPVQLLVADDRRVREPEPGRDADRDRGEAWSRPCRGRP